MYLIDTNVVSELRKEHKADANVVFWTQGIKLSSIYLSVITVQELEVGVQLMERRDPVQGAGLRKWITQTLPRFDGRILGIDYSTAIRCAKLHVPDKQPDRDAWIAATALEYGFCVVTRNVDDFAPMGVRVINPWLAP